MPGKHIQLFILLGKSWETNFIHHLWLFYIPKYPKLPGKSPLHDCLQYFMTGSNHHKSDRHKSAWVSFPPAPTSKTSSGSRIWMLCCRGAPGERRVTVGDFFGAGADTSGVVLNRRKPRWTLPLSPLPASQSARAAASAGGTVAGGSIKARWRDGQSLFVVWFRTWALVGLVMFFWCVWDVADDVSWGWQLVVSFLGGSGADATICKWAPRMAAPFGTTWPVALGRSQNPTWCIATSPTKI